MCWQLKDLDYVRSKLREDFRATRERGRISGRTRLTAWGVIVVLSALAGAVGLAVVGIVLFEGLVAPILARPPRPRVGPLVEWQPPDSYMESPEAPAPRPSDRR
jgi:hypothetical protein